MVLTAPDSSNLSSTLARDWALQVDTSDTPATPEWTFVRGLSQIAPVTNTTYQKDSDLDSGGYQSQIATALNLTITCQGFRKGEMAADAFVEDEGQAFLRAKGEELGYKNVAKIRLWRTDGVDQGYQALVTVQFESQAGGNEDLDSFTITMMSRGKPEKIAPVTAVEEP